MTLVAKESPGGAAGYEWAEGGDAGAIEVPAFLAEQLIRIQDADFSIVQAVEDKKARHATGKSEPDDAPVKTATKAKRAAPKEIQNAPESASVLSANTKPVPPEIAAAV